MLFFGAMFGTLVMRRVAERLGRKRGLIYSFSFCFISFLFSILSKFVIFEYYILIYNLYNKIKAVCI